MTPQEHDEALLAFERAATSAERSLEAAERSVWVRSGHRRRGDLWKTLAGADGDLETALGITDPETRVRFLDRAGALVLTRADVERHEREYTGWSRFRLVVSSDGHVHQNVKCPSFRKTTRTVVIPPLSGKTPEDAVQMLGNVCCSVCMPTQADTSGLKISSSLVNVLVRRGTEAFEAQLARIKARPTSRGLTSFPRKRILNT